MTKIKYTQTELENGISKCFSWKEVANWFGVKPRSGTQYYIRQLAKKYNISTNHFLGSAWNKGKKFPPKRDIQDYFDGKVFITSHNLKLKLFKQGIKKYQCENCLLTEWQSKPIPLELDHINGTHTDNRLENLRILCPNCHALTETYCSKNIKTE